MDTGQRHLFIFPITVGKNESMSLTRDRSLTINNVNTLPTNYGSRLSRDTRHQAISKTITRAILRTENSTATINKYNDNKLINYIINEDNDDDDDDDK